MDDVWMYTFRLAPFASLVSVVLVALVYVELRKITKLQRRNLKQLMALTGKKVIDLDDE